MNINPIGNSGYIYHAGQKNGAGDTRGAAEQSGPQGDRLKAELSQSIRETLASIPEIRPEVVERGKALLADPNYPSQAIVEKIAQFVTPLPEI